MSRCQVCDGPIAYCHLHWWAEVGDFVRLCSQRCSNWWIAMKPDPIRELNRVELEAVEASLPDVGAVVAEIGMDKPLAAYERDEILRLIFTAVRAVKNHSLEIISREEIPFDA